MNEIPKVTYMGAVPAEICRESFRHADGTTGTCAKPKGHKSRHDTAQGLASHRQASKTRAAAERIRRESLEYLP